MAADLHIHIFDGITEDDLRIFFSNTVGSKYFNLFGTDEDRDYKIHDKIANTPNIWIGEVSWLKAALLEDSDRFVPSTVERINTVIGEDLPILTEELIAEILKSFELENKTNYNLAKREDIEKFLDENKGKRVFTVSW